MRTLPPYFNYKYRFRYFEREELNDIDQIKHPSIKNCLNFLGFKKIKQGLEVVHNADVPALSGLGSSSLSQLVCYMPYTVTKKTDKKKKINVRLYMLKET